MRRALGLMVLAAAAVSAAGCSAAAAPAAESQGPAAASPAHPQTWYGVTLDDVTGLSRIVPSLSHLPRRPAVRIVFDPGMAPADYAEAVDRVGKVGDILAEPVDSSAAARYPPQAYADRFRRYVAAFAGQVALWEIGNEVNGDWLGPADRVRRDISAAYQVVRAGGGRAALTLSYEPGCAATPANDMWTWAAANIPARLRSGLDYVLVSYYADDCNGYQPGDHEWNQVFDRLHRMFPHARLGFGEIGTHRGDPAAVKLATLNRYYRLRIGVPGYIGGCFWWFYAEDMVPYQHNRLWQALAAVMR